MAQPPAHPLSPEVLDRAQFCPQSTSCWLWTLFFLKTVVLMYVGSISGPSPMQMIIVPHLSMSPIANPNCLSSKISLSQEVWFLTMISVRGCHLSITTSSITIDGISIPLVDSARCLGAWWTTKSLLLQVDAQRHQENQGCPLHLTTHSFNTSCMLLLFSLSTFASTHSLLEMLTRYYNASYYFCAHNTGKFVVTHRAEP